jgi:hypothetical protein
MDELHMVREGNHLVPVDEMSAEELAKLPLRQQVLVKVTMPRNLRQHRLAWALATKVAEACDWLHDREDAMDWLKIKARHVRYIHDHRNGETQIVPKSIRFAALDQTGFDRVFRRMVYVTVSEIIPGLDEAALRAEIESMVGIDPGPPPEPEQPKRRRRTRPGLPDPVSIIPAIEPVNAGDNPAGPAASEEPPPETQPTTNSNPAPEPVTEPKDPSPGLSAQPVPPPPPPASKAGQAALPVDFLTWKDFALSWIAADRDDTEKTDQDMMIRWNRERSLRNKCGVTDAERQPIFEVYTAAVEEKQKKGKPI